MKKEIKAKKKYKVADDPEFSMRKKKELEKDKKISRYSLVQLGFILGQLSHLQPASFKGTRIYILDGKIYEDWKISLEKIINKEI